MNKYANSDTGDSKVREPANSEVEYVRRLEVEIKVKHGKYCHEWNIEDKVTNQEVDKFQWRVKVSKCHINLLCECVYKCGKY